MRVLHILAAFPRNADDVIAPWLVEMLKRLRAEGVECEVFTSAYRGGGNREFAGIPVHRFRYFAARWEDLTHDEAAPDRMRRSFLYRLLPFFYVAAGCVAIWRLARRRSYDVIHVHWPLPHALFGWVARWAGGGAIVTTFYGVELRWVKSRMPFLRWFLARSARRSARVVAISTYTANEVRELADVPIEVIPYTVALPAAAARHLTPGRFTILFVGRLVPRKGVATLVEAVAALPPELNARLEIVGQGPEREAIEAQAARLGLGGRVALLGRVSDSDLQEAYLRADVFVLPSVLDQRGDTEGLGVVLLEAMNARVPVIASEVGGITDIVREGETGLLVPSGDPAALASALRRLAGDSSLAARLSEAGYASLHERFSWRTIIDRWTAIYREAAATK
jgi:glycosyltransferase involved in cell wall biosynthesis